MYNLTQYRFAITYLEEKQFTKFGIKNDYYGKTCKRFYLDNLNECFDKWEFYLKLEKNHDIKILYCSIGLKTETTLNGHITPSFYEHQYLYNYEKTLNGMEYVGN